jgi:hypothetical protein
MTQQQRLNDYPALTPVLMDYGWFIAPYINGEEHERVKKLVTYITANPPANDAAKRAIENKIHAEFLDVVFSTQVRARYVCSRCGPRISANTRTYTRAPFLRTTSANIRPRYACSSPRLRACCFRSTDGRSVSQANRPSRN